MSRVKPEIETFTGKTWEWPEWSDHESDFGGHLRKHPALTFMTHLRHCGFPSPILDWSRSPYVAAYFAFAKGASRQGRGDIRLFRNTEQREVRKRFGAKDNQSGRVRFEDS